MTIEPVARFQIDSQRMRFQPLQVIGFGNIKDLLVVQCPKEREPCLDGLLAAAVDPSLDLRFMQVAGDHVFVVTKVAYFKVSWYVNTMY